MTGNAAGGTRPGQSSERVRLETNLGAICIEVDLRRAPVSSSAFLSFVDEGRLQQAAFWRSVRSENDASVLVDPIKILWILRNST
jgi:peptidyl-prolyl cis-trans isomerase A (cyclophilin A)